MYELLEIPILTDSKGKSAGCLSPALDPEAGQVVESDGALLPLALALDVLLILKSGIEASTSCSYECKSSLEITAPHGA